MTIKCLISNKSWEVKESQISEENGWVKVTFPNRETLFFHKSNKTMMMGK